MFDDELFHVLRRVVQEHTARWQVAVPELTKPQYAVLRAVQQEPGIEQSALIAAAASTKATLAEMLQRLERRGLIERQGDPRDRRRRYVHLSAEGRRVLDEVVPRAGEVDTSFTRHLSAADQDRLLRQLHRMLAG
ncbi:MarR family winged helix-turn-helix transcriptional regulator [Kineococcus sp. SYSU DK005]|uniref:MarR family winged helix-turn-helix transcriptional regulator n=1 Tax=Kineococcus sp. SYSU DK005 TaxID=3383126 RepID=UPI003D7EEDF0